MKNLSLLILVALLTNCSSTHLINTWKNPEIEVYESSKILIVGITTNKDAQHKFEKRLQKEYEDRGIEAVMSSKYLKNSFQESQKSMEELEELEDQLIEDGFDSVIISKTIGVEDRIVYSEKFDEFMESERGFMHDYYKNQNIYVNKSYYESYQIYHAETNLYCICSGIERALIWKGSIDIIDPSSIKETVNNYVNMVMLVLEENNLLNKKTTPPSY